MIERRGQRAVQSVRPTSYFVFIELPGNLAAHGQQFAFYPLLSFTYARGIGIRGAASGPSDSRPCYVCLPSSTFERTTLSWSFSLPISLHVISRASKLLQDWNVQSLDYDFIRNIYNPRMKRKESKLIVSKWYNMIEISRAGGEYKG